MGITPRQLEQMQNRLASARPRPEPAVQTTGSSSSQEVILGIDPSLRGTGFGLIRVGRDAPRPVVFGTVSCPRGWERSRCLLRILETIRSLIQEHRPDVCVVEGLFYAQNLQTAQIMGEARGTAMAAVAEAGLDIYEIAPRKVKQAVVGYGAAQKMAVAKMVRRLLNLETLPEPDAADALALALAYAQSRNRFGMGNRKKL